MAQTHAAIRSFRDLLVWQKSMDLAVLTYRLTSSFPVDERFGLVSQMRRSASSVPANIAEGYGRESPGAYAQHLRMAQGSLKEFETHLELGKRLSFAGIETSEPVEALAEEIGKMLRSLIRSVDP